MSLRRGGWIRRLLVPIATLVALATYGAVAMNPAQPGTATASPDPACASGAVFNVVAHPDDDLLFLSPDLLHSIQSAGICVRTLYVTAGEAGSVLAYARLREAGVRAAYAEMAGVDDTWTTSDAGLAGHAVSIWTLQGRPRISVEFLQLPDGNENGAGFALYHGESLQKLYQGRIPSIHAIDGSGSYTKAGLTDAVAALMTRFAATEVRTQDFFGTYTDGDHSDHYAAAYFARDASRHYPAFHLLKGYEGYGTAARPANVSDADRAAKEAAFLTYAPHDDAVCQDAVDCAGTAYEKWWARQYVVASEAGGANHPPVAAAGTNQSVSPKALVTLDGSASKDPDGDFLTYKWKQTSGTTVTLSDPAAVKPTFVAPSILGSLTFSLTVTDSHGASATDTVTVKVGNHPPVADAGVDQTARPGALVMLDGSGSSDPDGDVLTYRWRQTSGPAATLSDPAAVTPTFTAPAKVGPLGFSLTVTDPYGANHSDAVNVNVVNHPPQVNAGPDLKVRVGSTVTLDGSGSRDPDGDVLTYRWKQTSGVAVALSDPTAVSPTFTAPSVTGPLAFSLTVTDPYGASHTDAVKVDVTK